MTRPQDLARDLGISGKTLRGWLRGQFPRSQTEHGQRWTLTEEQVQAAQSLSAHQQQGDMSRQHPRTVRRPMSSGGRVNSDEYYVIDLCDEILGEEAERGRRFPWLSGDAGTALPIDAYYPRHRLVVEYRERQHTEAVPFFDRRHTVSGVGRGEQRRIYDQRREVEIPKQGLRLVIVTPWDLDADRRGRLRRSRTDDRAVLGQLLLDATTNR